MIRNLNAPITGPATTGENLAKAVQAWQPECPEWVRILAVACDRTSQRDVAERIGQSSPTVSKVIRRCYPGDYAEIERKVRAALTADRVLCPVTAAMIQLKTCLRNRRRWRHYPPRDWLHLAYDRACPNCRHNTDEED